MKKTNLLRLVCIITIVTIIGFSIAACDENNGKKDTLDGTSWEWTGEFFGSSVVILYTFTSPNFSQSLDSVEVDAGTYTINGSTVTLKSPAKDNWTGTLSGNTLTIRDGTGLDTVFTKK